MSAASRAFAFGASGQTAPVCALCLGRAEASNPERGVVREGHEQRSGDAVMAGLRMALPADESERLVREGAALREEEAARIVLGELA